MKNASISPSPIPVVASDAETSEHLFDAFFTCDDRNGLGATIAKQIVDNHGGEISCNSSPETGTSIEIYSTGRLTCIIDKAASRVHYGTMTTSPTHARQPELRSDTGTCLNT